MRWLLTVEERFPITGRGVLVTPEPPLSALRGPVDVTASLRLPDGTTRDAVLAILIPMYSPPIPRPFKTFACLLKGLVVDDVPVGTEVWCPDEIFAAT
jgi:hypothetical protein